MKYEIKMIGESKIFTVSGKSKEEMETFVKYGAPNETIEDDEGRLLILNNVLYVQPKAE